MRLEISDSGMAQTTDSSSSQEPQGAWMDSVQLPAETLRVLVVEDDDFDFRIAKRALIELDTYQVEVHRATSVQEAKRAAHASQYDVVLVDFCLGMDTGVLALDAFGGRDSDAALILLTGMPGQDVQKIALKAGAIHCVNKNQLNAVMLETTMRSALHTHKLEKQLQQTIRNLEEANNAKNAFYANMGHDLKTPLNAILGYAEMITDPTLAKLSEGRFQEYAAKIRAGGLHLLEVINNLVLHSGDVVDKIGGEFRHMELNDLVSRAVELIHILAQNKNISIAFHPSSDMCHARCQSSLITQAIVNLLSNAVKYTPEGGHIVVRVLADTQTCSIRIQDNGIGMSEEELEVAMTAFGRVHHPAHLAQEGTGLGLPIVDRIVASHGGQLAIESQPGEGTRVTMTLPRSQPD